MVDFYSELTFNEQAHQYKLNGMTIPSVTTIMKPLSDDIYGSIDAKTLNRAAFKGTTVHNAIDNYIRFGIEDIPPENEGYFEAYKLWEKEHSVVPKGTEVRTYHKSLLYAGTADMIAVVDGEETLVDFKTTASVSEMLCGVQLEAYNKAFASHGEQSGYKRKVIVQLKADGTYNMILFDNGAECWRVFTALLTVRNYKSKYK